MARKDDSGLVWLGAGLAAAGVAVLAAGSASAAPAPAPTATATGRFRVQPGDTLYFVVRGATPDFWRQWAASRGYVVRGLVPEADGSVRLTVDATEAGVTNVVSETGNGSLVRATSADGSRLYYAAGRGILDPARVA